MQMDAGAQQNAEDYKLIKAVDDPDQSAKSTCIKVKDHPLTFRVQRNVAKGKEAKDEVLILERVDLPGVYNLNITAFIDLPEADENQSANCAEYIGSFFCQHQMTTSPRFSIKRNLEMCKLQDSKEILVTLVPRGSDKKVAVPFKGANIIYV